METNDLLFNTPLLYDSYNNSSNSNTESKLKKMGRLESDEEGSTATEKKANPL